MASNGTLPAYRSGLPVAVDAMGGDNGFIVQVEGAIEAYKDFGARSILVGPEDDLRSTLDALGGKHLPLKIRNASQVIAMDDSPARAVRRKPDSSLCVAYQLVQSGEASAILSSGNSGAMMAAGRIILGLLPGIERPAIATLCPVACSDRPNVILDSGANVECHAQNLVQFAVMGAIYYSTLFEQERPKVALLSNGTEASKGTDVIRATSMILSQMDTINYIGYVEGRDVTTQAADVIVCDGFVGNILLKSMEGCVRLIFEQLRHESKKGLVRKLGLGLSKGVYREVFAEKFDYTAHGGAPLLGLTKLAVVLHGSSDARAVKNAIRLADSFVARKMTEKIAVALTQLDESMPATNIDGEILSGVFATKRAEAAGFGKRVEAKKAEGRREVEDDDGEPDTVEIEAPDLVDR
ncbi:MAG: phosphate acyltransferase PlsX [Bdellovibrionales bacterium]|nr:phosphate acyltransferase PlsX [Bdellovibrionales bacterium]